MTPEAQRIAIAEACGWFRDPSGGFTVPRYVNEREDAEALGPEELPDYLGSLDAMHEAETVLTDWPKYQAELFMATNPGWAADKPVHIQNYLARNFVRATAAQRAEAFLRAIGKWKEAAS